jgi:hypothetical protein
VSPPREGSRCGLHDLRRCSQLCDSVAAWRTAVKSERRMPGQAPNPSFCALQAWSQPHRAGRPLTAGSSDSAPSVDAPPCCPSSPPSG